MRNELLPYLSKDSSIILSQDNELYIKNILLKVFPDVNEDDFSINKKFFSFDEHLTINNSIQFNQEIYEYSVMYKDNYINFDKLFEEDEIRYGSICRGEGGSCFEEFYDISFLERPKNISDLNRIILDADNKTFSDYVFVKYIWSKT